jgi:hypothetical protein
MTVVDLSRAKRVHKRAPRDLVPIDRTGGAARDAPQDLVGVPREIGGAGQSLCRDDRRVER